MFSQVSVATWARSGGSFSNQFSASLPRNFPGKQFCKSVKIWQNYGHEFVASLFCRLRVACAWCGLIIMKFICLNGSTSKEYNIQSIQYALENQNTRNVITIIKKENKKWKSMSSWWKLCSRKLFFCHYFHRDDIHFHFFSISVRKKLSGTLFSPR